MQLGTQPGHVLTGGLGVLAEVMRKVGAVRLSVQQSL